VRVFALLASAFTVLVVLLGLSQPVASAQQSPTITDLGAENIFPEGVLFSVHAESDAGIERIRLRYSILPDGTAAIGQADIDPGESVDAEFHLEGNSGDLYLSPGTVIEYHWEATDADGNTSETTRQSLFYDDTRFGWDTVEGDGVTVYYYSGGEDTAGEMHATAVESLAESSALLQAEVPFEVLVWIYENTDDMRPALRSRSETYESQIITAGVRVATNTVLVLGNASFDTLRHELMHVVTAQAGESAFGTLPAWLDEGTAVYAQDNPGGFGEAVERAIDRGNVFSVREITAYPGDPAKVTLFYGQGWSLVTYLVDTHGEADFARLFAEVKSGKRIDNALEAVYGFDQDGLDAEWRAANGLPPRETAEPTDQPQQPGETDAPDEDTPAASSVDDGTSVALIIGIAAAVLLLAALVGGAGIALARRL
jgi:hypothetical protein